MENSPSEIMGLLYERPIRLLVLLWVLIMLTWKALRALQALRRNPSRLPFPPGPKGYPFVGNLFDMPTSHQWRVFADWAKVYGDILSFDVLGQRIIVLNSLETAQDLFEKRSANYSDRPRMPMLVELANFGHIFGLIPYGQWWRRQRKAFNNHFHANAVANYHPIQTREARIFLSRLLQSPERFVSHARQALASSIMDVAYGIKVQGFDDPYIKNIVDSIDGFNTAGVPGAFLVDLIPALKYVPSWFPGAGFKRRAAYWARVNRDVVELPFKHVMQQMKEGTAGPSVSAALISGLPDDGDKKLLAEETQIARNVASIAYLGGADTTFSAIQTFFLAMAMHPEVQKKAQVELDTVIGTDRLPEFSDRPFLPYVNAIVKETMRWQLIVPLAFAHMATNDDVYNGFFIPKGAIVLGNSWAILHDKRVFTEPEEYCPERYLKDGQLNPSVRQPEVSAFGFGRRICGGQYFGDNTLFIIIASTLHALSVTPGLDENGTPLTLLPKMSSGIISYPEPFKVDIKPRGTALKDLIKDATVADN